MSYDDALRDGQAEAGAARFLRDERLEDEPAFFRGDARSRIRTGNQHLAVASIDIQAEATLALHGLPLRQRTAGTWLLVGGQHFLAAPTHHRPDLFGHPAIGMPNGELAIDELEPLPQTIHEPLVKLL